LQYQEKEIRLGNPLFFWKHFDKEERVLFFNPLNKELIIGAKRLKTFAEGESLRNFLFVFSSRTFFQSIKDQKWAEFGNETIAFEYYFFERNGKQTLFYFHDPIEIENMELKDYHHSYEISTDDYEEWKTLFTKVSEEISAGNINKAVISREVKIECDTLVNAESILNNLLEKNPSSFVFAYYKKGKTFLGATPEILVQKEKDKIISYALAGTISRNHQNDEAQKSKFPNDRKNCYEHQIVVDFIVSAMKKFSSEVTVGETKILTLKNLHHLQTKVECKDNATLQEWVTRLHPTPALGGNPVHKALEILAGLEKHERGLYAAPLGIMDENGEGIFVAGIRSALVEGNTVFAYTGSGIVDKSECEDEYLETDNKLRTIIESL